MFLGCSLAVKKVFQLLDIVRLIKDMRMVLVTFAVSAEKWVNTCKRENMFLVIV